MFILQTPRRRRAKEEAEKPFWISFSDLMTALMVLFLIAMAVALLVLTQSLRTMEDKRRDRETTILACLGDMAKITLSPEFDGVKINGQTIDFGPLAEFSKNSNQLSPDRIEFLRAFVPEVLEIARNKTCQPWLRRFLVEGFASQEGTYLHNLNLSLERSQRVLCVLLDPSDPDALRPEDRKIIRQQFLVGGSSFNSAILNQPEKSRRVALRLEFKELRKECLPGDAACFVGDAPAIPWDEDFRCPVLSR